MFRSFAKPAQQLTRSRTAFNLTRAFSAGGKYDVVVIGGGPGGYVAAIKAAQMGMKVACVEMRGSLGGTCLNVGCIPSKALLNASHHYHDAQHNFKKMGITHDNLAVDLPTMMKQKGKAVTGLTKGIEGLFKKNKVDYVVGKGSITSANSIDVALNDGGSQTLSTDKILIATGSEPASLPGIDVDEKSIVTSTGALDLKKIPESMVVIGGGVIGLEMGSVYSRLGSKVTVVEFLDALVPGTDHEIAKEVQKMLKKQKFAFKFKTKVTGATKTDNGVQLTLEPAKGGESETLDAEVVLVATGRRPYTSDLGLENLGINMTRGMVDVDDHFQTNVPGIYAIGDVIKGPMLAHKAEEEGIAAIEIMSGKAGHVNYDAIPGVIYTHPEVATVGATEQDLKEKGIKYNVGKFPMMANSRARTNDDAEGIVKVISDKETDRILGMHIVGPNAGELIAEGVLAMEYGASSEDIARTCHAHPTLSEAVKEACMATYDKAIHF
jgi:dihydrolipoamide dehydrogenase